MALLETEPSARPGRARQTDTSAGSRYFIGEADRKSHIVSVIKMSVALALLLCTAIPTSAHHSFAAEYDVKKLVTVSGVVTRFEWTNPHALLFVDGTDAEGEAGSWKFEMGAPGGLERRGWKKSDLQNGDRITVDGYAAKDGTKLANARTVTLADGRKLFGGFQSTPGNPFK